MKPPAAPAHARQARSFGQQAVAFLVFVAGYFLLGMAGVQLQSAQTGVTPIWPASGFAFAMVYWFGSRQLIAILPAMLMLGWVLGVPPAVAAMSAAGSMLEAGVPAYLLHRFAVDPGLRHLRDALLFVVLVPVLGPVFSATVGSMAFHVLGGSRFDLWHLWLLWWLGNSVGLLLVGGFGLVVVARRSLRVERSARASLLVACAAVTAITALGLLQVTEISSPLVLYLLIPVFVFIAQRGDQFPVLLLSVVALAVTLLSAIWLPPESLAQTRLGVFYLDVSLLWIVTFTAMMISSARQEVHAREQISWLASHDPLTRMLNRHAVMERLDDLLSRARSSAGPNVLMYLDLDRFKDINDTEGHVAGDQVLRDIGVLLGEEVRAADTVARLGGDEFAVLLEDCSLLDACSIAENVRSAVERYEYAGARGRHRVEVSIGLLELSGEHASAEDAMHEVDSACYDAKRGGRNRVCVYSKAHRADGA